jgi:hypothetical protein
MDVYEPPIDDLKGRLVRSVWVAWAEEQPDVNDHPHWLVPYQDLEPRMQEVDNRIGEALYNALLPVVKASLYRQIYELVCQGLSPGGNAKKALRDLLQRMGL